MTQRANRRDLRERPPNKAALVLIFITCKSHVNLMIGVPRSLLFYSAFTSLVLFHRTGPGKSRKLWEGPLGSRGDDRFVRLSAIQLYVWEVKAALKDPPQPAPRPRLL